MAKDRAAGATAELRPLLRPFCLEALGVRWQVFCLQVELRAATRVVDGCGGTGKPAVAKEAAWPSWPGGFFIAPR